MTDHPAIRNPAEEEALIARGKVHSCIELRKSFVFEAGAGAGKTYSLIDCLRDIINKQGNQLIKANQKVACITYTNVAKDEIRRRIDSHPAVLSETIHSFCWSLMNGYQKSIREMLPSIGRWAERINSPYPLTNQTITYTLGYPSITEHEISLYHDDVIELMIRLLDVPKFRSLLCIRYPILFIDEYQDTRMEFAEALKMHFIDHPSHLLVGLFGDHWQTIYGSTSCGEIKSENLEKIGKKANFRSVSKIVAALNNMRPELPQMPSAVTDEGTIDIFHTNNWRGVRRSESQWRGDLPESDARSYLEQVRNTLASNGWFQDKENSKILMLTHRLLAAEQGYSNILGVFNQTDDYIKKQDAYIAFFADVIEPICTAYIGRHFGEMFTYITAQGPTIQSPCDKRDWINYLNRLCTIRQNGTIGEVIDYLRSNKKIRLSDKVDDKEKRFFQLSANLLVSELEQNDQNFYEKIRELKSINYSEVVSLVQFIQENTPFATNHGVKGEEYDNVLVVVGRGWNQYNFDEMLSWVKVGIPKGRNDTFERNRNLFYVACSRPQKSLAILFTQKLSEDALHTLKSWFGESNIHALPDTGTEQQ